MTPKAKLGKIVTKILCPRRWAEPGRRCAAHIGGSSQMYQCHIQFYLMGQGRDLFDLIRRTPPLDRFSHAFSESARPDAALCAGADVIIADLRGLDGPRALGALLSSKREDAELIAAAGRDQLPGLASLLPRVKDLWLDPAADPAILIF